MAHFRNFFVLFVVIGSFLLGCDNPAGPDSDAGTPGGTDFDFVADPAGPFVLTPRMEMQVDGSFLEFEPQAEPIEFVAPLAAGITLPDTRAEGQAVERTVKFRARVVDPASPAAPPAEHIFTVTIPPVPPGNLTTTFGDGTVRYRFLIPAGYSASSYTITLRPAGATGAEDETITGNFPATFNDDITFARDYVPDFTALQEEIPFGRYIPQAVVTMTYGGGTVSVSVGDLTTPPPDFWRVWAFPA